MIIREVNENKKQFISLLLLADEQENMIDRYIEKGDRDVTGVQTCALPILKKVLCMCLKTIM